MGDTYARDADESLGGSKEWSVQTVHLVIETTGVAQVMACSISPPQGGPHRPAVHALLTLSEIVAGCVPCKF